MITPIRTMTINEIAERKNDLLMSDDDIKELAKNIRNRAIDEFAERLKSIIDTREKWILELIDEMAEEMRGAKQ